MARHNRATLSAVLTVVAIIMSAACGDVGDGINSRDGVLDEAARGRAVCAVTPNPTPVNVDYQVVVQGLGRERAVSLHVADAAGSAIFDQVSDRNGEVRVTARSSAIGPAAVLVYAVGKNRDQLQTSCTFEVIAPVVCGDRACNGAEDCSSCSVDCGACPSCGDGECNGDEDCESCSLDCGVCAPVCGDGQCNGNETCGSCSLDCGACPMVPDCHDPATWPAAWSAYDQTVLAAVNQYRASGYSCGGTWFPPVPALTPNTMLTQAARCHSLDMAQNNFFDHAGSDGSSAFDRITAAGYSYTASGENIAAGLSCPNATVGSWMSSAGHCANIMSASFTEMGIGRAENAASTYGIYWTQTFGNAAAAAAVCGDRQCNGGETCSSCSADCGTCPPSGQDQPFVVDRVVVQSAVRARVYLSGNALLETKRANILWQITYSANGSGGIGYPIATSCPRSLQPDVFEYTIDELVPETTYSLYVDYTDGTSSAPVYFTTPALDSVTDSAPPVAANLAYYCMNGRSIRVDANDDSGVQQVEFFVDGTSIGATHLYSFYPVLHRSSDVLLTYWLNLPAELAAGSHAARAVVTDIYGKQTLIDGPILVP